MRGRAEGSIVFRTAVVILLLSALVLCAGCRNSYTRREAVDSILSTVEFRDEGGLWRNSERTLNLWAKPPKAWANKGDNAAYEVFGTFVERCYFSIKSCHATLEWIRISVGMDDGRLWVFTLPFDKVEEFHRAAAPVSVLWESMLLQIEEAEGRRQAGRSALPPPTPEVTKGYVVAELASHDVAALFTQLGADQTAMDWDAERGWFSANLTSSHTIKAVLRAQIREIAGKALDRRSRQFGLAYAGVRFAERYGSEAPRTVSYTRGALQLLVEKSAS